MRPLLLAAFLAMISCETPVRTPEPPAVPVAMPTPDPPAEEASMSELKFEPVALSGFPPLTTTEFFGKQEPDGFAFADALSSALESKLGAEVEQTLLFNGGASRNSLAFVYMSDQRVRGVEFTGEDNLKRWFAALAEGMDGSTVHTVTSSGVSTSRFAEWDELLRSPGDWARSKAPKSHFKDALTAEKGAYFAFSSVDTRTQVDATRFRTAFDALVKARSARPTSPSTADLEALERAVGSPLPLDLRALYTATGGVEDLFHGFNLLSAKEAAQQRASWSKIYDEWTLEELLSHQAAEPGIHPVYCTPRWIPFVDLVGGNYLAVDLGPASGGTYGQIITMGADVDHKRLVASSLTEFIEKASTYDGAPSHELFGVFGRLKF